MLSALQYFKEEELEYIERLIEDNMEERLSGLI